MDELQFLREAWDQPDPPSPNASAQARAALMYATQDAPRLPTNPKRPRISTWLAFAMPTAAAVVIAVAVVVAPGSTAPSPPNLANPAQTAGGSSSTRPPTSPPTTGRNILLAAATTALAQPTATGTYWHVKFTSTVNDVRLVEWWIPRDGLEWGQVNGGPIHRTPPDGNLPFLVGGSRLSYEELQRLPTEAGQLTAWIVDSFNNPTGWAPVDIPRPLPIGSPGPGSAGHHYQASDPIVAESLANLLYVHPTPPAVRAAAFDAIAAMPEVTSLGSMDGGVGLRISVTPQPAQKYVGNKVPSGADRIILVIDPATSQLLRITYYYDDRKILIAGWTNQLPPGAHEK